ncbi:flavin-containing monooxygenase [Janibacter sp. GS2]|uniref:flavin-containing monooxygenase n=1 Tax=Janibacter sp. GS2 TaxID=3442646 RepID=UPI003EBB8D53
MTSTLTPEHTAADLPEHLDVVIVGAGISGIGMAYRLQESMPLSRYAILESRPTSGGTWDLFRYPGVRSDSDMYTFAYPFRPWRGRKAIADGADILDYVRATAQDNGIEEHIHYGCRVTASSWSTPEQRWTITVRSSEPDGSERERQVTANHLHLAAGYYDYEDPHSPQFAGVEDFDGRVVHPQFWPEGLDYTGQRVVVIGSGATAITLLPSMTDVAAHVTMLQRTPSYIFTVPERDRLMRAIGEVLPKNLTNRLVRAKNVGVQWFFYRLSRVSPAAAKAIVMGDLSRRVPPEDVTEHFTPPYDVWDQRLCAVPDGDFFRALRSGSASVVTEHIDRFVPEGIRLANGEILEADLVVSATGLQMKALGGIHFEVDGVDFPVETAYAYRGMMLSGLPNTTLSIGYVNASWTLRADLISRYTVRLLMHMRQHDRGVAVPIAPGNMPAGPIMALSSGYMRRAVATFPKVGDRAPWTVPQSYVHDTVSFARADITDSMHFIPRDGTAVELPHSAPAPASLTTAEMAPATGELVGSP